MNVLMEIPPEETIEKNKSLTTEAAQINKRHDLVRKSARKALVNAIKAGILLRRVKRRVGHGNFTVWIAAYCTFSPRTAELYMKVAGHKEELLKTKSISFLTGAIKLLRQSNSPDKNGEKKDTDLQDDLAALSKTLVTARTLMQRIEKKRGWQFWRRGNKGLLARVEENAVALSRLLRDRFPTQSG